MSVVRHTILTFATLCFPAFAAFDVQTTGLCHAKSVRCSGDHMCHTALEGDHAMMQSRGVISRTLGSVPMSPAQSSSSATGLVALMQNNTEAGSVFVGTSVSGGEHWDAGVQFGNSSLDNKGFSASVPEGPSALDEDRFDAGRRVDSPNIGTNKASEDTDALASELSHGRKGTSWPSRSFVQSSSKADHSSHHPQDFAGDRQLHLAIFHLVTKACAQALFQTRSMGAIAIARCGLAPFTAELVVIALLIVMVLGSMLAAAVFLADIGNGKQSLVLCPIAHNSPQSSSGPSQSVLTPPGPSPVPIRVGGGSAASRSVVGPRISTPDMSQHCVVASFEPREVASLQKTQTRFAPLLVAQRTVDATNTADGEATIYRTAAERAAQYWPQIETQAVNTMAVVGGPLSGPPLCPSLIVPAGLEFVFAMPCVLTSERQDMVFNVVDLRGRPLSQMIAHENCSHNRNRIMLQTVHNVPLAEVNTQMMHENPGDLPYVCRPEGEVFCSLVCDASPAFCHYILRHVSGQVLLNFRGDFHQKAVMVTSAGGQLAAKTELCVANFEGVPHYEVRVAPEVDAGLVLCGLVAIDKVQSYSPPAVASKGSASAPVGLRDVVRNLQVPRIDQLAPEFRRG